MKHLSAVYVPYSFNLHKDIQTEEVNILQNKRIIHPFSVLN